MKKRSWLHALRTATLLFLFIAGTFFYTGQAVQFGAEIGFREAVNNLPACFESNP